MISAGYSHGTGSQPMAKTASNRKKKASEALTRESVGLLWRIAA